MPLTIQWRQHFSSIVEFTGDEKTIYDAKSEIINLYPNPNNGHFTIDFLVPLENPKNEIVISDMVGNQIYRETITAEQTTKQFDLPNVKIRHLYNDCYQQRDPGNEKDSYKVTNDYWLLFPAGDCQFFIPNLTFIFPMKKQVNCIIE